MDERAHEGQQGPSDADDRAAEPEVPGRVPAPSEPLIEPPPERPQPDAAAPFALWPRAAGGGAGAVAALVIVPGPEALHEPVAEAAEPAIALPPPPDPPAPAEPEPDLPDVETSGAAEMMSGPILAPPPLPDPPTAAQSEPAPPQIETAPSAPEPTRSEIADAYRADAEPAMELPPPAAAPPPPSVARPVIPTIEPVRARRPPEQPFPMPRPFAYAPAEPLRLPLPPSAPARRSASHYLRLAARYGVALVLALTALVLALVLLYRWVDPPVSTLMLAQQLTGTPVTQRWVPLARISPNLHLATIMSEDARFCRHRGVDWEEIEDAIERARDGIPRGGSTISMQVVKNLFLWSSKSYLRKAIEIPLTYVIEAAWSKQRILEIYLNIAEWGPGIFGADAASRYHFRKSAALLTPREAALLAVSLPNPFERQAGSPGSGTQRLADNLLLRMRAAQGNAACVRTRPAGR